MLLSPIQTKAGMLSPDGFGKVDAKVAVASLGGICDASLACPDSAAGKTDEAPSASCRAPQPIRTGLPHLQKEKTCRATRYTKPSDSGKSRL